LIERIAQPIILVLRAESNYAARASVAGWPETPLDQTNAEVAVDEVPVERRFAVLSEIMRAQHFAWREAVRQCCSDVDPTDVVDRMWLLTGRQTSKAYLKRLDCELPIAPQVARSIAWSSQCMGEDAVVEEHGDEVRVRHRDCPWFHWHKKLDLLAEDQPGCDRWFGTLVADINAEFGTELRVETLESLPEGGASCLRRLWVEDTP